MSLSDPPWSCHLESFRQRSPYMVGGTFFFEMIQTSGYSLFIVEAKELIL